MSYNIAKTTPNLISNHLGNSLVGNITKPNKSKVFYRRDIVHFRNEGNEGIIKVFNFPRVLPNVLNQPAKGLPHSRSLPVEEHNVKHISPMCFENTDVLN